MVTGASKGIGLAMVEAILAHCTETFVYLAARDPRARAAGGEAF